MGYLTGITPGATTASKALVVDSSRNINNLNWIYSSSNFSSSLSSGSFVNMYNGISSFIGLGLDGVDNNTFKLGLCTANGGAWTTGYSALRVLSLAVSLGGGDWSTFIRNGLKSEMNISNYFCYNSTNIASTITTSSGGSYPFCWPSQSIAYNGTDEVVWGKSSSGSTIGSNIVAMSKNTDYYTNTVKVKTQFNTNSQMIIKRLRVDNAVTDSSYLANVNIKCDSTNVHILYH